MVQIGETVQFRLNRYGMHILLNGPNFVFWCPRADDMSNSRGSVGRPVIHLVICISQAESVKPARHGADLVLISSIAYLLELMVMIIPFKGNNFLRPI